MAKKQIQRIEPSFEKHSDKASASLRAERNEPSRGQSTAAKTRPKSKSKPKNNKRGWFRTLAYWSLVIGVWVGIGLSVVVGYYASKLPHSSSWNIPDRPPNVRILSASGALIANRGVTGGRDMRLEEMSPYIPMAVIAIEDRRFKSHFGIDPIGLVRAMVTNLTSGHLVQGGSTLTQQLAKNLFLEPKRNLERKVHEAILALWLENEFSKDEILELYLNRVYFGSGAYGVDSAARRYFNKSARDVNLAEAALLAGLLKAPSRLSPAKNPKLAEARAQIVLSAMHRSGFVSDRETATAMSMQAKKAKRFWSGSEHYVADMIMKQLPGLIGEAKSDLIIDTTIDYELLKTGGQIIANTIRNQGEKLKVSQGAMVAMDGTGAIRALVGGAEYADSQFNRAVDAKRQPGSAFKPIVYLAALESGFSPDTVRLDRPIKIGKWTPGNYDRKFRGPVTLGEGLSLSLNTIAAQMVLEVGPKAVTETAKRLGINSPLERNASIALGTSEVSLLELTSSYAPFANGGYLAKPYMIKRITTEEGKVIYDRDYSAAPKIMGGREVSMMNQMLRRVVEEGTGKAARVKNWQVAGKTGTSQNSRDALFVGYTANLVAGFWYGNDDGKATNKVTGGSIPARSFAKFMQIAHNGVESTELMEFYLPKNISIVPTPRPQRTVAKNQDSPSAPDTNEQINTDRRPLSTIPQTSNAGAEKKPKNILELLLGG